MCSVSCFSQNNCCSLGSSAQQSCELWQGNKTLFRESTGMTAPWPGCSFPWIRRQKSQANEKHDVGVFVLKPVVHSAGCALEAREILSGVRSLPKEGAPVYPESVALPSRGDTSWTCSGIHGNHWEPVCIMEYTVIGQAQHLAEVYGRIYWRRSWEMEGVQGSP